MIAFFLKHVLMIKIAYFKNIHVLMSLKQLFLMLFIQNNCHSVYLEHPYSFPFIYVIPTKSLCSTQILPPQDFSWFH